MSANREDPTTRSVTSTSFHGRNTFGQNIPHDSDNSSDFDVWLTPNISDVNPEQVAIPKVRSADVNPEQVAIPKVRSAASAFPTAWKDCHVSIKRKADMKILEQCSCKESDLPPVKMQYLLNFHFKELETALCDELFKLKWTVTCVKPGDQCLSIEVKHYTDESVLEDVILLFSDEVNKVNYCHSMQASKHPELLLKEYIDSGNLAIYVDGEKVCIVGIVENQRKVTETLRKKPTSTDYSSTAAYKTDIQFDNSFKCQLLIYPQFLPSLKQKYPSVNVTMDEEKNIMSICGDNHVDVHAAVEEVHLFTKDFIVEDIELDPLLSQLLKLPDMKMFIKKLCEEQDLKVIWTLSELNNRITCHCKDRKALQDLKDILHHNLEKKTYQYSKRSFGDKAIIFSTTNMFSEFVKKYDGKCLVSTVEGNSIHIFTTRVISNDLTLLEVNFERTKTDIQKNLTQDGKKEIHDERTEVGTSVVQVPMPHQELQMLKKFNFKTYQYTQIPDVQVTITDDGIDSTKRRLNVEATQGKSMIDRTKKTQKTTPTEDLQRIAAFDLSPLEYTMLKFYCGDCRLFVGKYEYTGGKLLRTLVSGEGEDDLKFVLKDKMDHLRTLSSIKLQYSPGIEDNKLHEIEHSLSSSGEILCYRVDSKNLTFYGFSYEKLGVAKHESEILLGLKQQRKGRRNRVIVTDQTLEKDDDKTRGAPKYQTFHDGGRSMSYKGSSATVLEQIYKTSEGIIVKVYNGNILSLKVDCIVNAANSQLSHGGGVAEVISRAAGYRFQQESDDYIQRYGSLDVGTCCSTSAGDLMYKNVIHTVGPKWYKYTDKNLCCSDLKMAVECCFYEAEVCNVSSITIPSISAGISGVPVSVCTQQYALAVEEFSHKNGNVTCLREIHFIERDPGLVLAIQNEFNQKFHMAIQGKSMIDRTKKTQKTTPTGDIQRIAAFDLSPLEYTMLKFYCGDCRLFVGKYEYTGGKLLRTLVSGEGEDDLKFVLKDKMDHLRTLSSIKLQYSPGIEDEKLHDIERSLSSSEEILCYRVDSKNLTFYGFSYEKLGVAKHESEILLGLKQQRKGRRNRVIVTDQTLEKDDDKTRGAPKYQTFHDGGRSMSYKGSSATVLEQIYKTSEGIIVKVYNGNILSLKVDCIVNAANSQLSHGGGVAEVISRAAGYRFQQESDDYIQRYGSLDVGTCCSTSAGNLMYKNVIHTVGPKWYKYTDKNLCCSDLKMAVECCFYEAEVCNVSSIAIPSISAGISGVPVSVCTQQYALAVEEFSRKNGNVTCLREIHFIERDPGLVLAIQNEFNQKFHMVSSGSAKK